MPPSAEFGSVAVPDPTLHFPRILALHGGGTNAIIFKTQCRVLEPALNSHFRLVYVQAPFPSLPGPDVLSVYKEWGPFKAWLVSASLPAPQTAAEKSRVARDVVGKLNHAIATALSADDLLGATGPVVATLGFSQGAKLAASILMTEQTQRRRLAAQGLYSAGLTTAWPDLRFAVLMAGRGPFIWLEPESETPEGMLEAWHPWSAQVEPVVSEDAEEDEHLLALPTLHVHGLKDVGLEFHRKMLEQYCAPGSTTLIEWDGDHRLPIKSKDVRDVVDQVIALGRATGVLD
ncbi:serine hydrolase FSH [Podospora appendiculata]|uniref:Serine hydrolase FSH n=1 Tax=Podospora appendiculata TaxID=314037 RepID=A0AAE0XJC3_9PEZI|nr:serine hydrolase FSH [Podospora appendiculata]